MNNAYHWGIQDTNSRLYYGKQPGTPHSADRPAVTSHTEDESVLRAGKDLQQGAIGYGHLNSTGPQVSWEGCALAGTWAHSLVLPSALHQAVQQIGHDCIARMVMCHIGSCRHHQHPLPWASDDLINTQSTTKVS